MISEISEAEFVMKILLPLMTHSPFLISAVVWLPPASLPAFGSVRPNEASALAAAQAREPLALLLVVAEVVDGSDAERVARGHRRRRRAVHPCDLLDRDAVREIADVASAVLLGNEHAEEPELAHFLHEVEGELLLLVELLGDGFDLLFGELAHGIPQYLLLLAEVEIRHVRPSLATDYRPRSLAGLVLRLVEIPYFQRRSGHGCRT